MISFHINILISKIYTISHFNFVSFSFRSQVRNVRTVEIVNMVKTSKYLFKRSLFQVFGTYGIRKLWWLQRISYLIVSLFCDEKCVDVSKKNNNTELGIVSYCIKQTSNLISSHFLVCNSLFKTLRFKWFVRKFYKYFKYVARTVKHWLFIVQTFAGDILYDTCKIAHILGHFDEKAFIFQTCVFEQMLATFSILAIVFITL